MNRITPLKLILLTPIFILLSHYLAVFPHEYAHSFTAWLLGHKTNPLAILYGGTSWSNLLLLSHIDENVNYDLIFSQGQNFHAALIAFAGPGIANGLLFILSFLLLKSKSIKEKPYTYYFLFWFNLMNLGNFYDYVPIRTFATHGDIAHLVKGLNISPWYVYIIFGYLVAFLIWQFFTKTMPAMFSTLDINTTAFKASLMIVSVCILFGFFGKSGLSNNYGELLSITSLLAIPGIIITLWPTRKWANRS